MVSTSIDSYLQDHRVAFRALPHPRSFDAQRTAASTHVSGRRFAKTVVVKARGQPVLVVLPADEWVDLEGLGDLLGGPVTLCSEAELGRLFPDCEVGAMPPLGGLYHLPVVAHACLASGGRLVANGGSHSDAIELAWEDFVALEHPRVVEHGELFKG